MRDQPPRSRRALKSEDALVAVVAVDDARVEEGEGSAKEGDQSEEVNGDKVVGEDEALVALQA